MQGKRYYWCLVVLILFILLLGTPGDDYLAHFSYHDGEQRIGKVYRVMDEGGYGVLENGK